MMQNKILLDCTLRDGGYVNDFNFGNKNITKIISQLTLSGVEIVECGFLEDINYNIDKTIFNSVNEIEKFIPKDTCDTIYVAMIRFGKYSIDKLIPFNGKSLDGIRVAFHLNELDEAIEYCREVQKKGYKVFIQPVGTSSYNDTKILSLIEKVNDFEPYAFYFVDTLGLMQMKDIVRLFYLIDNNLSHKIALGFHSHNNLQLSFSNSQNLVNMNSERIIILDSSIYGMGRGAGNLNTELIANYINQLYGPKYIIEVLLEIVDEYIGKLKQKYNWGYSVPYYLAAINGCHPNYASFLINKHTLTVKSIGTILRNIELEKKSIFDESYITKKYKEYQYHYYDDSQSIIKLKKLFDGRNILLLGSGNTILNYQYEINQRIKQYNCIVISVGFIPKEYEYDYVFVSNLRRFETTFKTYEKTKLICTSNISVGENGLIKLNYSTYLSNNSLVMDNSLLIMLNVLSGLNVGNIFLGGMDGYSKYSKNYFSEELDFSNNSNSIENFNKAITEEISDLNRLLSIKFITPSLYVNK